MSLHEYQVSMAISVEGPPFYALIFAAMRQADTYNSALLAAAFPDKAAELRARYAAPAGILPGDLAPDPESSRPGTARPGSEKRKM